MGAEISELLFWTGILKILAKKVNCSPLVLLNANALQIRQKKICFLNISKAISSVQ